MLVNFRLDSYVADHLETEDILVLTEVFTRTIRVTCVLQRGRSFHIGPAQSTGRHA